MPSRDPPGRVLDALIALVLLFGSTAVLVATDDMGFTRDEAFYFGHAETYQNWFVRLEGGRDEASKALDRREILDTWRHNSEHPPLDKILFGWSWRAFGRKLRPAAPPRLEDDRFVFEISGLGPAHGFQVGRRVALLAPQVVGEAPDVEARLLSRGHVLRREPSHAVVRLDPGAPFAQLRQRCQPPGPAPATDPGQDAVVRRTGCEAVELRPTYFLSESAAMRLPGAWFGGLVVAALYLAARMAFASRNTATGSGTLARPFALLAALGYLCLPHAFYHAHLCVFDTTIAALLLLTTLAWHRSLRSPIWIWLAAVLWGLSLLAKHNALFLPVPLAVHWLWHGLAEGHVHVDLPADRRKRLILLGGALVVGGGLAALVHPVAGLAGALVVLAGTRIELPPLPAAFFAMLPIGMLLLVLGWPLLWVDTFDNLLRWIEFHLHHEHYMQTYFGRVLAYPPFPPQFPWVMTLLTWTLTLLAAFFVGLAAVYAPRRFTWLRDPRQVAVALRRLVRPASALVAEPVLPPRRKRPSDMWVQGESLDDRGRTEEQRSFDRLVLLSIVWPMALISMPGTPIFGGIKHWLLAYPFMLLVAGRGAHAVWQGLCTWLAPPPVDEAPVFRPGSTEAQLYQAGLAGAPPAGAPRPGWLRTRLLPALLAWGLVAVVLLPAAQATLEVHPHGTAYFNELVGGVPGAAEAGMQRQFWGGVTREGLPEVNRRSPERSAIWFHKSAWGAYMMYQREGWFRRDLRYGGDPAGTALGLFHHQKDHDDYELDLMRDYGTKVPVWQAAVDGVPMLSVYERPAAAPTGPRPVRP